MLTSTGSGRCESLAFSPAGKLLATGGGGGGDKTVRLWELTGQCGGTLGTCRHRHRLAD